MSTLICYTAIGTGWKPFISHKKSGFVDITIHISGAVTIDWGDGVIEQQTNSRFQHTYADTSEKTIKLRGDAKGITGLIVNDMKLTKVTLRSFPNITGSLSFADSPELTLLELPNTRSQITTLNVRNANLSGILDFREIPNLGGEVNLSNSTGITGVLFSTPDATAQGISSLSLNNTSLAGTLDLSMLHNLSGNIYIYRTKTLQNILWPVTSARFSRLDLFENDFTGTLDLRNIPNLTSAVRLNTNAKCTGILFGTPPQGTPAITTLTLEFLGITGTLDLSMLHNLSGVVTCYRNRSQTGLIMPATAASFSSLRLFDNAFTGTLDLSMLTGNISTLEVYGNPNLTDVLLSSTTQIGTTFSVHGTKLNKVWPLGTQITANSINISNCGMTQENVNANVANVYNNRANFNNATNKNFSMHSSNAAASGVFQAPAGYVQGGADGTPATAKEMLYVLQNQTNADGSSKYKWTLNYN